MSKHDVDTDLSTWAAHGACTGADPELFFPEPGDDAREARSLCRVCPVRTDCLAHALATNQRFGIWGGRSASQRQRIGVPRSITVTRHRSAAASSRQAVVAVRPIRHLHLV